MTISLRSLKKSVVNITNTSTNKAFQVLVDPSRLQSPFNGRYELFAPCHVLLSSESRIHTRIEPLDLEFLDFNTTAQGDSVMEDDRDDLAKGADSDPQKSQGYRFLKSFSAIVCSWKSAL
ncbi:hypothetical protein Tco_1024103 [Tanacetum coccineum]